MAYKHNLFKKETGVYSNDNTDSRFDVLVCVSSMYNEGPFEKGVKITARKRLDSNESVEIYGDILDNIKPPKILMMISNIDVARAELDSVMKSEGRTIEEFVKEISNHKDKYYMFTQTNDEKVYLTLETTSSSEGDIFDLTRSDKEYSDINRRYKSGVTLASMVTKIDGKKNMEFGFNQSTQRKIKEILGAELAEENPLYYSSKVIPRLFLDNYGLMISWLSGNTRFNNLERVILNGDLDVLKKNFYATFKNKVGVDEVSEISLMTIHNDGGAIVNKSSSIYYSAQGFYTLYRLHDFRINDKGFAQATLERTNGGGKLSDKLGVIELKDNHSKYSLNELVIDIIKLALITTEEATDIKINQN